MSRRAWVFIFGIIGLGVVFGGLAQWGRPPVSSDWLAFGVLVVLATLSQLFKSLFKSQHRSDKGNLSYSPLIVFLFAGVLVLPAGLFVGLVIIPHLIDWIKTRLSHRPQLAAWYIQPFNIATHIICGMAARQAYTGVAAIAALDVLLWDLIAVLIAAILYIGVNHLLVGSALMLARGVSWQQSGILAVQHLSPDLIMTGLGYAVALLWKIDPWLILPTLAPLLLIHRALKVPQLEKEARLFETAKDGILLVNGATGQITDVNPGFTTLLGYAREELLGRVLWAVKPFSEITPETASFGDLIKWDAATYDDLQLRDKEGRSLWVEFVSHVYPVGNERVLQCTLRDITKRKQAEEALSQAKAELEVKVAARTREVHEAYERLQAVSQQLVRAQEVERAHLARELHDEIGQALTVAKINLQTLRRLLQASDFAPQVDRSIRDVERTMSRVRQLSRELRPSVLDDLGLGPALRSLVDQQGEIAGFSSQVIVQPLDVRAAPDVETACFRVVQEALTNIMRHAQARQVVLELRQYESDLELVIRDDGVGFDPAALPGADDMRLGLIGIQERILLVGGHVEFHSAPGQGTEIRARVPLEPAKLGARPQAVAVKWGERFHEDYSRPSG
jgi:PAS domain S-box-containing protein